MKSEPSSNAQLTGQQGPIPSSPEYRLSCSNTCPHIWPHAACFSAPLLGNTEQTGKILQIPS